MEVTLWRILEIVCAAEEKRLQLSERQRVLKPARSKQYKLLDSEYPLLEYDYISDFTVYYLYTSYRFIKKRKKGMVTRHRMVDKNTPFAGMAASPPKVIA